MCDCHVFINKRIYYFVYCFMANKLSKFESTTAIDGTTTDRPQPLNGVSESSRSVSDRLSINFCLDEFLEQRLSRH